MYCLSFNMTEILFIFFLCVCEFQHPYDMNFAFRVTFFSLTILFFNICAIQPISILFLQYITHSLSPDVSANRVIRRLNTTREEMLSFQYLFESWINIFNEMRTFKVSPVKAKPYAYFSTGARRSQNVTILL